MSVLDATRQRSAFTDPTRTPRNDSDLPFEFHARAPLTARDIPFLQEPCHNP